LVRSAGLSLSLGCAAIALIAVIDFHAVLSWRHHHMHIEVPPTEPAKEQALWTHGLNEDGNFNARLNFFLLFQSFLIAGVLTLYSYLFLAGGGNLSYGAFQNAKLLIIGSCDIGIVTCLFWMYVQVRQEFLLEILRRRIQLMDGTFEDTIRQRERGLYRYLDAAFILSHVIPTTVIALWWLIILCTSMQHDIERIWIPDIWIPATTDPILVEIPRG
jgi:hypothetical protein